ncbi:hypothetical protein PAPYR_5587 [Paratrimastix pyriformis]|uniref:Senescence domain-containing protein n=1 Tax=Paratrimastix pyriformis TaxID=342808 RepID=A0ABQ8UMQ6_9EUKA|nr:hypothetical protein PAPYR_5587 [Paratrimastix pyriformis]
MPESTSSALYSMQKPEGEECEVLVSIPNAKIWSCPRPPSENQLAAADAQRELVAENVEVSLMAARHQQPELFFLQWGSDSNIPLSLSAVTLLASRSPPSYVFPAVDRYWGVVLPNDTRPENLDLFNSILTARTLFHAPTKATPTAEVAGESGGIGEGVRHRLYPEVPPRASDATFPAPAAPSSQPTLSHTVSPPRPRTAGGFISHAGEAIGHAVVTSAESLGGLIARSGQYFQHKMKQPERPAEISSRLLGLVASAQHVTGQTRMVTNSVLQSLAAQSRDLADATDSSWSRRNAGDMLFAESREQARNLIGHRYGENASRLAVGVMDVAADISWIFSSPLRQLVIRTVAQRPQEREMETMTARVEPAIGEQKGQETKAE